MYCHDNSFGNGCHDIKFKPIESSPDKSDRYRYNHFGDGCKFINFWCVPDGGKYIQYYNFGQGVTGNVVAKRDKKFEIKIVMSDSTTENPT